MVFFGTILKVANILGLLTALHKRNPYYKIITGSMLFGFFVICFHTGFYYQENVENFDKSTLVIGGIIYCLKTFVKVFYFLYRNNEFLELYFKLKKLCDNPIRSHYKQAQETENTIERLARRALLAFIILLYLFISNPLFLMLYEYLTTGSVVKYRREFPIPFANPFIDINKSPVYEFVYGGYALAAPTLLLFGVSADLLFMATCYHIHGLFGHLKERIRLFNNSPHKMEYFRSCVDYQNSVYEIVNVTQRVFADIFFIQFAGTTIILCTQVYLITQVGGFTYVRLLIVPSGSSIL